MRVLFSLQVLLIFSYPRVNCFSILEFLSLLDPAKTSLAEVLSFLAAEFPIDKRPYHFDEPFHPVHLALDSPILSDYFMP